MLGLAAAIQLSVAAMFLLTAVAALLGVISNRLARVLDRALNWKGPPAMRRIWRCCAGG